MRAALLPALVLLVSCGEVVPEPTVSQQTPLPPPAPPHIEAAKLDNCSSKSRFGPDAATQMLKLSMRWAHPDAEQECTMVPPTGTDPFFSIAVLDHPAIFDDFAQKAGVEIDRDAVPGAERVAWVANEHTLVAISTPRAVIVTIGSNRRPAKSVSHARMQAKVIATKLLAYFSDAR